MRVYERDVAEDGDLEHIPADVVHHYMLAICTRPGVGVCFKDRGWYPRELDQEEKVPENTPEAPEEGSSRRIGRIYNKILANVLKMLKVNEDPRQQELALKILAACPELVAGLVAEAHQRFPCSPPFVTATGHRPHWLSNPATRPNGSPTSRSLARSCHCPCRIPASCCRRPLGRPCTTLRPRR